MVFETTTKGPAGTNMYGITHNEGNAVAECFMCSTNALLPFEPRVFSFMVQPEVQGYVIPSSRAVMVRARGEDRPARHLLPIPFSAKIIPLRHMHARNDRQWNLSVPDNWMHQLSILLGLAWDLDLFDPFNLHHQYGNAAGAERQGWEHSLGAHRHVPHGYTLVTYGRNKLTELDDDEPQGRPPRLSTARPMATSGYGFDHILHESRVAAGSLPANDQELWDIWERYAGGKDAIGKYHDGILALPA